MLDGWNKELGAWVHTQRRMKKKSQLLVRREAMLEEIEFRFAKSSGENWMTRYNELKRFKELNGHCDVPRREPKQKLGGWSKTLGGWVDKQRQAKKKSQLSVEREALLEEIGFTFCIRQRRGDGGTDNTTYA